MTENENTKTSFTPATIEFHPERLKREGVQAIPAKIWDRMLGSLDMVAHGLDPSMKSKKIEGHGPGLFELVKNGSPAYRCVYYTKIPGKVIVLFAGVKTATGGDKHLIDTVVERLKAVKQLYK